MGEEISVQSAYYIPIKDFDRVCLKLKESNYERTDLNYLSCYHVNGFSILPIKRNQSLQIIGNPHGIEDFLKKEEIEKL
jgi:hypothetical protein